MLVIPQILKPRIEKYAELVARRGLNVQPDQDVIVLSSVECAPFVRIAVAKLYDAGASRVHILWKDEECSRLTYDNCPIEAFEVYPPWNAQMLNELSDAGAALLKVDSEDPLAFVGIDPDKLQTAAKAEHTACEGFHDRLEKSKIQWCIAGVPSSKWASRVFPGVGENEAIDRLWKAILSCARVPDDGSAVDVWAEHEQSFTERKAWLNSLGIGKLHYKNSLGTDFTVALPEHHIWHGGNSQTVDGVTFSPNIPTEEVYTSPDCRSAEGTVFASLPLAWHGNVIEGLWLRFEAGSVVEWGADRGEDVLTRIIEMDDGTCRLGEVALVPHSSPIRESGILFWNTLYDENASCHLALGASFPECVEGGLSMTREELTEEGLNESLTHVDFMIGTYDLSVDAECRDGRCVALMRNGEWAG